MKYIRLLRVKHYIKNLFVLIPLFFSLSFRDLNLVFYCFLTFCFFSLTSSSIYIINDCKDCEVDRMHPKKCKRPIASKEISLKQGYIIAGFLIVFSLILSYLLVNKSVSYILLIYWLMNLAYTYYLKQLALIDVMIIALGFILRIYAGSFAIRVETSQWLLLTSLALSLYLGFGKRYGEFVRTGADSQTRQSLRNYTKQSLETFLNITMTATIIFYSLYTVYGQTKIPYLVFSLPLVFLGFFRYHMLVMDNIEDGDPTEVLFKDFLLLALVALFGLLLIILYLLRGA